VCFEHEPYRERHDEDQQAAEEIRRLFERYRRGARHEDEAKRAPADEAPDAEPVLTP